jgi:hypothetical protein
MGSANRDRTTGRYTDARLDRVCACGHTLGSHTAERAGDDQPCVIVGCVCDGFRRARRAPTPRPRSSVGARRSA